MSNLNNIPKYLLNLTASTKSECNKKIAWELCKGTLFTTTSSTVFAGIGTFGLLMTEGATFFGSMLGGMMLKGWGGEKMIDNAGRVVPDKAYYIMITGCILLSAFIFRNNFSSAYKHYKLKSYLAN